MFVDQTVIAQLEVRYGRPASLTITQPITAAELQMVRASMRRGRRHDMTVFMFDPRQRIALIRKHSHPPGAFRAPSGGVEPGEPADHGALREAYEETGLAARLHRYVLRVNAKFIHGGDQIDWSSHVFTAACPDDDPRAIDTKEIAEVRFGTMSELMGPIRTALLRSGRPLLRYRVSLTDTVAALLALHPDWRPQ